ncbi:MAG: hypothetical protein BMS9Abin37_1194 [Acidobacteriota bacterium]|nr:MAG: hypothetical protein BMS9Abin37_1194 [Acidobacteriota bacterium]
MGSVLAVAWGMTALASGQYQTGEAVRVSVEDLSSTGMLYHQRLVITKGEVRYGDLEDEANDIFELRGDDALRTVRIATQQGAYEDLRFMSGQQVEVTGIFFDLSSVTDPQYDPILRYFPGVLRKDMEGYNKEYFIAITNVELIVDLKSDMLPDTTGENTEIEDPDILVSDVLQVDLRELVKAPENYTDREIAVLGKFRGNNLYGDLSIHDKRTPRDFVIKTADAAIWVTGRRPRGKGFKLDASKRRDTGKWLMIIGTTWKYEPTGTYYLRAEKVEIAEKPDDKDLTPVKVVHEKKLEIGPPPEVTFSLPLDGERDIPLDSEFHVQFSNDMKRESFNRNVDLLYFDDDGIGNPFPELEVSYDDVSRTLTVLPNKPLEPGKDIRLILYDGIEDDDGQKIVSDPSAADVEAGAAVILTFATAQR